MDDAQKIALIASFLLRYPDESWYNELGEWKEDTRSVEHPQLRQGLLEFFDYIEETDRKAFEDQYDDVLIDLRIARYRGTSRGTR